jgi:DNA-binding transcriptional LysR family regulator
VSVVERATEHDVERVLEIAASSRAVHAQYQPQFWHPAADAVSRQRAYFTGLLSDEQALIVVARSAAGLRGFGTGRLVPAPPVYDPGGHSCLVDDLAVVDLSDWGTVGPLLLGAFRTWATGHGAAQMVVVTAHLDEAKRAVLTGDGLTIASEWWVGATCP